MSCEGEDKEFNFGQVEFYLPVRYLSGDINQEPKGIFALEIDSWVSCHT